MKTQTWLVHPFKHLIVRPDIMYPDEFYSMDRLTAELEYKWEKERIERNGTTLEGFINKVAGTNGKKGKMVIPATGWIELEVNLADSTEEIWKQAMDKFANSK